MSTRLMVSRLSPVIDAGSRLALEGLKAASGANSFRAFGYTTRPQIDLRNAIENLKQAHYAADCPLCNARGCQTCNQYGWVTRSIADRILPEKWPDGVHPFDKRKPTKANAE